MSKVPEVTVFFWITKVLTTGMGETTSDYLAHRLDPVIAVGIAGIALAKRVAVRVERRDGAAAEPGEGIAARPDLGGEFAATKIGQIDAEQTLFTTRTGHRENPR